jgi:tetratricopeptide (TPR) repeat protein
LNLHWVDVFLLVFAVYVFLNAYIRRAGGPTSFRFYELSGLLLTYVILRHLDSELNVFALVAVATGGLLQVVNNQHKKAILILEHAKQYAGNTILQTALGDSYKALGLYREAEEAYQLAADMLPDRFYARYLFAKLYSETGQTEKLLPIARYLLEKEPKIPSSAVDDIKAEMDLILRQNLEKN